MCNLDLLTFISLVLNILLSLGLQESSEDSNLFRPRRLSKKQSIVIIVNSLQHRNVNYRE